MTSRDFSVKSIPTISLFRIRLIWIFNVWDYFFLLYFMNSQLTAVPKRMVGWVRVLRPFNSISVISRRWKCEHERLCAMKRRLGSGRISPRAGFEPATPWSEVGSANRSATRTLPYPKGLNVVYVSEITATTLTYRDRTTDVIYCADVTLFLHATSGGLSLTAVLRRFLAFYCFKCYLGSFSRSRLRFHPILYPTNTLNKTKLTPND